MICCDICTIETKKTYCVNDELLCEACFNEAVSRAEYYFDSAREEGLL